MKNLNDTSTIDLFPEDLIITKLKCTSVALKKSKDKTRVSFRLEGYTNARTETDLCGEDYLNGAAEMLVSLCCSDDLLAREMVEKVMEKYSIDDLCNAHAVASKPVVSGGNIGMTYSTNVMFDMDLGVIVEKETLIKLIAQWVIMLAKGDDDMVYAAINTGYLRIANRDNVVQFQQAA